MQTTVEADGDDLVLVIPPEILDQAVLQIGDKIEPSVENGVITIKRCG